MKIAVFGGTGHVAKYLLDELIAGGHSVRLLSRRARGNRANVESFVGDVFVRADVRRVMEGCQVVINCLGQLKNDAGFYAPVTSIILETMLELGVTRYLLVTNATVRLPSDSGTFFSWAGSLLFTLLFPKMIEDKQREFELVAQSSVDWVVFRLPLVFDSRGGACPRTDTAALRGFVVTNGAVAKTIAQEIANPQHSRTALFLFG